MAIPTLCFISRFDIGSLRTPPIMIIVCLSIILVALHIFMPSAAAITSYIRYREVEYHAYGAHTKRANKVTLTLGLMSALGISIVGNFQVSWVGTRQAT